jgi:hypothetical protein
MDRVTSLYQAVGGADKPSGGHSRAGSHLSHKSKEPEEEAVVFFNDYSNIASSSRKYQPLFGNKRKSNNPS